MKKNLILFLFLFFIFIASFSFAGSVTLTTYYPAPFGNYDTIRLVPRAALATPCDEGTLYVQSADKKIYLCSGADWVTFDAGTIGIWTRDDFAKKIIVSDPDRQEISVGIRTDAPRGIFDVDGSQTSNAFGAGQSVYLEAQTSSFSGGAAGGNIYLLPGSGNDPGGSPAKEGVVVIGGTTKVAKLTILNDGGIYASGTYGSGRDLSFTGAQTAMIWYPKKGAFRAGAVFNDTINPSGSTYWNDANIGDFSVAMGQNSIASGVGSIALGIGCSAGGGTISGSNVFGGNVALGYNSTASSGSSGYGTIAIGSESTSSSEGSVAIGTSATASNTNAVAIGSPAIASGTNAVAIRGTASGDGSMALGTQAVTEGNGSYALGTYTSVPAYGSTALGGFIKVNADYSVGIGVGPGGAWPNVMIDTPTNANTFYVRGGNVDMKGNNITIGGTTATVATASGTDSIALGRGITVSGTGSVGIGLNTTAAPLAGNNTFYVRGGNVDMQGGKVAMGNSVTASGKNSVAIGNSATARGTNSVAIGDTVTASGIKSFAFGMNASATGTNSVAIGAGGIFTSVQAMPSIAIGYGVTIPPAGIWSTALGDFITLNAPYSVGIGVGNVATSTAATSETMYILGGKGVVIGDTNAHGPYNSWSSGSYAKLSVYGDGYFTGGVKIGRYSSACNGHTVGLLRYGTSGGCRSYLEVCMQTSAVPTYQFVVIVERTWGGC